MHHPIKMAMPPSLGQLPVKDGRAEAPFLTRAPQLTGAPSRPQRMEGHQPVRRHQEQQQRLQCQHPALLHPSQ